MSRLSALAESLTSRTWTPDDADAMVGPHVRTCVANASAVAVRSRAASGGAVTALLISALERGEADACLVARTEVNDGHVGLAYSLAHTAEEVLAAQGSTYALGDFARDAVPLIAQASGRVAVVCLPCEATLLSRRPDLAPKIALVIALFCGHATRPDLIDHVVAPLAKQAGAPLAALRFRSGHWRGVLTATFENGETVERPFAAFGRLQNLYYASARKCMACDDHFGYHADVCAGDLWSAKYQRDPIKRTAIIAKTEQGAEAVSAAQADGQLDAEGVPIDEILDGQRRVAPFHHNVTARARAARRFGMSLPDQGQAVAWHERLAAHIVVRNFVATSTPQGLDRILRRPAWFHKLMLYVLKGLESLS